MQLRTVLSLLLLLCTTYLAHAIPAPANGNGISNSANQPNSEDEVAKLMKEGAIKNKVIYKEAQAIMKKYNPNGEDLMFYSGPGMLQSKWIAKHLKLRTVNTILGLAFKGDFSKSKLRKFDKMEVEYIEEYAVGKKTKEQAKAEYVEAWDEISKAFVETVKDGSKIKVAVMPGGPKAGGYFERTELKVLKRKGIKKEDVTYIGPYPKEDDFMNPKVVPGSVGKINW